MAHPEGATGRVEGVGKPNNTGLLRALRAMRYSARGLAAAFRHESAFRQELALLAILLPAGWWLGRTPPERAALIACCLLVLIVELLNSAVEATVDRVSLDEHPLAKRAKDIGSAAVAMSLVIATLTWGVILFNRFY
jgi:diacylglycerol kinase (ATP)